MGNCCSGDDDSKQKKLSDIAKKEQENKKKCADAAEISGVYIEITMDIVGDFNQNQCKLKTNALRELFATNIFEIERRLIELFKAENIQNGLKVSMEIYKNDQVNYKQRINDAKNSGELQRLIKSTWNLRCIPGIENMTYSKSESKHAICNVSVDVINMVNELKMAERETNES
eukprot:UN11038